MNKIKPLEDDGRLKPWDVLEKVNELVQTLNAMEERSQKELASELPTNARASSSQPIEEEQKLGMTVVLWLEDDDGSGDSTNLLKGIGNERAVSKETAQATAEAIQEVLGLITMEDDINEYFPALALERKIRAARKATQAQS